MGPAYSTYSVNDTDVRLYKGVPIADGMYPIWQSAEAQFEDWQKHRDVIVNNSLYVDGSKGTLNLSIDPARALACDYLTFVNHKFEGKIFYARITDTRQISNVAVTIDFVIDNFQTYMFDFKMRGGVVLREHLTEEQHQRAIENPWREDIPELFTDEGFSLTSAEEVKYKRDVNATISKEFGLPLLPDSIHEGNTYPSTPLEAEGVPGLVTAIGAPTVRPGVSNPNPALTNLISRDTYIVAEVTQDLYLRFREWVTKPPNNSEDLSDMQAEYSYSVAINADLSTGHSPGTNANNIIVTGLPGRAGARTQQFVSMVARARMSSDLIALREVPKSVFESSIRRLYGMSSFNRAASNQPERYNDINLPSHIINVPRYSNLYGGVNPKLERFPFRYVRVNSPIGDDKEFMIEKFDGATPILNLYGEIAGDPALHVVPVTYNGHPLDLNNRLTFSGFPLMPSESSAYINYINNKAVAILEGDTQNAKRARDIVEGRKRGQKQFNWANPSSYVEGLAPIAQKIGETVGGFFGVARGIKSGDPQSAIEEASRSRFERMQARQAEEIINGNMPTETFTGEQAPGGTFAVPRGLTAGHGEYTAGSSENSMLLMLNRAHFEAIVVTYQREVIKSYSDFLEAYGYRSDSVAQPRVMDYIRGGVGPRFVNMDGLTFTYCQTEQIKIYGVTPSAAADIAAVFNGGARFTKGF